MLLRFLGDEGGATAIEYGLITALIAAVIIVALTAAGGSIHAMFDYIANRATSVWNHAASS